MKYRTFRNLALAGVAIVVAGGIAAVFASGSDEDNVQTASPKPAAAGVAAKASAASQRPSDYQAYLTRTLGRPAGAGAKQKDALGRGHPKVNVYEERAVWGRAKVDLDRDDKWDEKWTYFADGRVEKKVAPADDERYTETYSLSNGAWQPKR